MTASPEEARWLRNVARHGSTPPNYHVTCVFSVHMPPISPYGWVSGPTAFDRRTSPHTVFRRGKTSVFTHPAAPGRSTRSTGDETDGCEAARTRPGHPCSRNMMGYEKAVLLCQRGNAVTHWRRFGLLAAFTPTWHWKPRPVDALLGHGRPLIDACR